MKHQHTPADPRIFVFGSNLMGVHGAGAAKYAHEQLRYPYYHHSGVIGRACGIPTCRAPGKPLPLRGSGNTIEHHVDVFLTFAAEHPEIHFFVSAIGCGFAGYTEAEIAPLFVDAPGNCDLPPGWRESNERQVCTQCGDDGSEGFHACQVFFGEPENES